MAVYDIMNARFYFIFITKQTHGRIDDYTMKSVQEKQETMLVEHGAVPCRAVPCHTVPLTQADGCMDALLPPPPLPFW